jgi:hypothetical protein
MILALSLALASPVSIPVTGNLTDAAGMPVSGPRTVTFTLYERPEGEAATALWSMERVVVFDAGAFATHLDAGPPPLDSALFRDHTDLHLGVQVEGDAESALAPLGSTPLAAYAAQAGLADVASSVSGVLPTSNLPATVAYTDAPQTFSSSVTAASFTGSGAGLTDVPSSAITGLDAALTAYLPKAGGALTGGLTGTTAGFSGAVTAASFTGSGAGLTNVPSSAITGLDAALTGYLAKAGGALTGGLTGTTAGFSGAVTAASFSGSGASLTGVDAASLGGAAASSYLKPDGTGSFAVSGTGGMGFLGLAPRSTTPPTCDASREGMMYYSSTDKQFYGCDGTTWQGLIFRVPGATAATPGRHCLEIKTAAPFSPSGLYWIDPDGTGTGAASFQAYCQMTHAGGGWTLVFNLDTNDGAMRSYSDTAFWTTGGNTFGAVASALQNDFKGTAYGSLTGTQVLVWAHQEGVDYATPAYARYTLAAAATGKTFQQIMALGNNTTISTGTPERLGSIHTPGAYSRSAGDAFIDNGLPIIVNSTGAGGTDATNTVRFGTDFSSVCSTVSCNGHNVQGGYGGYHIRGSSYPITYEAQPVFGYHPGPVGFGDNFVNNNGCGNSVWSNTCGPETVRFQVDFALLIR